MVGRARASLVLLAMLLCVATAVTARTRPPTVEPTPTATPFTCDGVEFPQPILDFQFSVEPPQPVVGNTVVVTVTVRNTNGGFVGRPEISMSSSVPVVSGLTRGGPFHWSPVAFELMAVQPGTTALRVGMTYEARTGCCGYCYTPGGLSSPPFLLTIGGGETLPDLIPEYLVLAPVGGEPGCATNNPDRTPIATEVCVRNVGGAAAGPFVLAKDQQQVRVDGLAAGASICAAGFQQERYTSTALVQVDVDDEVRERDENNNQEVLPAAVPTPLPVCDTPTITPIPVQTPTGGCAGDCDASGQVRVDELVLGVQMMLAGADSNGCIAFDMNDDSRVAVNELVAAVDSALRGCGAAPSTALRAQAILAHVGEQILCYYGGPSWYVREEPGEAGGHLECFGLPGHNGDVIMHGFASPEDALTAMDDRQGSGATETFEDGLLRINAVVPECCVELGGLSQDWAWARGCWLIYGGSFDDTSYRIAPQPRSVIARILDAPDGPALLSSCIDE